MKVAKSRLETAIDHFESLYESLYSQFKVAATFKDESINFEISDDWSELKQKESRGIILFRSFFVGKDGDKKIKSVHNKWTAGAMIPAHYHSQADEIIFVVSGVIEIKLIDVKSELPKLLSLHKVHANESPFIIPRSETVAHEVTAIEKTEMVVKFEY